MPTPIVNKSVQSLKVQGDEAYEAKDFSLAIDCYSEALDIVEDPVVLSNRSAAHAQKRNFEKACEDANRALSVAPQWARPFHRLGHALFHLGRYGEAIDTFSHGVLVDGDDVHLQDALMRARAFTESFVTAQPEASPRVVPQTTKPVTPTLNASTEFMAPSGSRQTGPRATFRVVYTKVVVRETPSVQAHALEILSQGAAVQGAPWDVRGLPWLQLERGWMLIDGKSLGLGQLLSSDDAPHEADSKRELGNKHFREKKYSSAVRAYSDAIDLDPQDARSWANRAAAQIALLKDFGKNLPESVVRGNSYFQSALSDLEQSLSLDSGYLKAWIRKGQLHTIGGEKNEAIAAFDAGLKLDPSSTECKEGRALSHQRY
uniref:Serine/threonine-protein kinase BSK1-like TPR repeats domain-containing protein n=1 Tax=Noctiluca scintillans TaxID=2966 RepID=A0A7S0ZT73_NOCSC|mmetsp:Transcript_177/g.671  ORF Transcript_177/g.671 Transcript_177/m.671 type:complete len:374 (+) Transcript_177:158-1279(+)|eukprot:CAMPEP_0194526336 /NCGR_PEP_ID=MMETSP0253-20130528/62114_1 /TAXON_ID=2966 /ORGANISM="Noctiluca scintillans" /LENGTH=373 /DNA_ID=CAMNT_0039371155 /DNA_START=154 /DNA_END=1272 /DNA_ORIENTATION=-